MLKNLPQRILVCVIGYIILCFGIVFTTKAHWGVAPINSVPYFVSEVTFLTLGQCTMILYVIVIVLQILMKKKLTLYIVLQLPITLLFGQLVDLFNTHIPWSGDIWYESLIIILISVVCVALGIDLVIGMKIVANAPDAFVNTAAETFGKSFGLVKNIFDLSMAAITIVFSLLLTHHLIGVGIGTIIIAVLCGRLANLFKIPLKPILKIAEGVDPL